MLTQELVKELFDYNPITGNLLRRISTSSRSIKGNIAGTITVYGYRQVYIRNRYYKATQIIWLYLYGQLLRNIDHINGLQSDDRLINLRTCTKSQNSCNTKLYFNSKTGVKGVTESYVDNTFIGYRAIIKLKGFQDRTKRFGVPAYGTKEEALILATKWIKSNREDLHGNFAKHG